MRKYLSSSAINDQMKRHPQILTSRWFLFFRRRQQRADSPGPSCVSMKSEHYMGELRRIRSEFVKGVSDPVIKALLDDLYHHEVFSSEEKDSVMEEQRSRADQARCLIDTVMGKGERASQRMIDGIKERDKHLCINLGLSSSLAGVGELQRIRSEFVKGVSDPVIKCLLDDLWQQKVFSTEEKDSVIEDQKSKVDRARCLIDMVMGKGERAGQLMIDSMKKRDEHLCSTLGLMSSPAGVGELLP
uniref:CARD domain-containing protein n=1 Tax=Gadus morhua TaxID=8049 RepID=A0A8C5D082_GADMO